MESVKNESAQQPLVLARQEKNRTVYTRGKWELSVWQDLGDEEPRALDTDVAKVLGFKQPRQIRELIERIWPENKRPCVRRTVVRTQMPTGGTRETKINTYWLTEAQVLKVCARSETEVAEAILDDMIATYLAVRSYRLGPTIEAKPASKRSPNPEVVRRNAAFRNFLKRRRDAGDLRGRDDILREFIAQYRADKGCIQQEIRAQSAIHGTPQPSLFSTPPAPPPATPPARAPLFSFALGFDARAIFRALVDRLIDEAVAAGDTTHAVVAVTEGAEVKPFAERWTARARIRMLPVTPFELDVLREALATRGL